VNRLTLVVLLAATFAQGAAVAQSSTARITGRVVYVATGEPIIGARVILSFVSPPGSRGTPVPSRLTATNADGVFSIPDLPLGRWQIRVQTAGFFMVGWNGPPPVIEVTTSGRVPDVQMDLGGAIAGRVLDATANPAGGISVVALQRIRRPDGTMAPGGYSVTERTNDLGEFRLAGLPAGEYVVLARPTTVPATVRTPVASPTVFVETYYHGVTELAHAAPFTVTSGATTAALDLKMIVVPAYRVSGVALDAGGRPVPGTVVRLWTSGAVASPLSVTAQSDGTFRIVNVPAGTYRVQASPPSRPPTETAISFREAPVQEIVVHGGDVAGIQVTVGQP